MKTPLSARTPRQSAGAADPREGAMLLPIEREALQARLRTFESARTLADQADAFVELAGWVLLEPEWSEHGSGVPERKGERFRAFVELIEGDRCARRGFVASFGRLLAQSSAINLFGEAGLPGRRSFLAEAGDRVAGKLVPSPRNDADLAELLRRLIPSEREFRRLRGIPADLFHRFVGVLAAERHGIWAPLERDFADGYRLLALWVQSQGLGSRVRSQSGVPAVSDSPFHRLGLSTARLVMAWQGRRRPGPALAGGWLDNFTVYNRIPEGISDHRLGRLLGRERMIRLGRFVARNVAGWGTNISLGFLLGFTPAIGSFLGIPLDVRHVTLSSGMLAIAAASMDARLFSWGWFLWGIAGVGTMFVLNLSVSFILSLSNAAKAYDYTMREVVQLLGVLCRHFYRNPLAFILPPRAQRTETVSARG